MKLYAETSAKRTSQLLTDLLMLGWVVLSITLGRVVHDLVGKLAAPGKALQDAGGSLTSSLNSAAKSVGGVPFVGDALRDPLQSAASAGRTLSNAGAGTQTTVSRLALILGLVVAITPILAGLAIWLPQRLRWIRGAGAAAELRDEGLDLDVFALRALVHQPLHRLTRLGPDPAAAYLRQQPGATRALAELELSGLGLRAPDEPVRR